MALLVIGLINTSHELEWPRGTANGLLSAICSYLKYDTISAILPAKSMYLQSKVLLPFLNIIRYFIHLESFCGACYVQ